MSSQHAALPSRLAAYRHYSETTRLLPENVANKKRVAWEFPERDDQWKYSASACSAAFVVIGLVHDPLGLSSSMVPEQWRLALGLGEASLRHHSLMAFYLPSILGALSSGVLCNLWPRHYMLGCLAILASVSCMLASIGNFAGFVASHMLAGVSVGASLPLVYSLVGDWFPAAGRPRICALISTVSAATLLLAQIVPRWRYSSFALACPALAAGLLAMHSAEDPVRGGQEDVKEMAWRPRHEPALLSFGHLIRAMLASRTTSLVFLQAIPGNLAWGMVVVSFRDFLRNDLLLSPASEFAAVVTVITTAFVGVLIGGVAGQALQASKRCHIVLLAGICNLARVVVFALLILFGHLLVPSSLHPDSSTLVAHIPLFALLALAGAISTAATPCISTVLLNFNLPETRGSAIAVYAGLEDVSKVIGATFAAIVAPMLRGRLLVHLFVLLLWLACAVVLLLAVGAHEKDENQLHRRLDEDVRHRLVRTSKQNAQVAVQKLAKAAGEAHSKEQVAYSSPVLELPLSSELLDSLPSAPGACHGTP